MEFVRSHFLVREGVRFNRRGNSNPILQIDRIDKTANRWKKADVLVFNTGHWWTHGKTARGYGHVLSCKLILTLLLNGVHCAQTELLQGRRHAVRSIRLD